MPVSLGIGQLVTLDPKINLQVTAYYNVAAPAGAGTLDSRRWRCSCCFRNDAACGHLTRCRGQNSIVLYSSSGSAASTLPAPSRTIIARPTVRGRICSA